MVGQYEQARGEIAKGIASRVADGKMLPAQMVTSMRESLRDTYVAEYMAGRGGRNAMTQADYGRLGHMLRDQYKFLNDFAAEIADGKLSEAQIASRASLYFNSATQAFERGRAAARGISLPAHPGDGSSECRSNCACKWDIEETDTEWRASWVRSAAEHCPTCNERASTWNPLVIRK